MTTLSPHEFHEGDGKEERFELRGDQIASLPPAIPLHCSETMFLQRIVTTRIAMDGMQQAELCLYGYGTAIREAKITIYADKDMQALEAAVGKRFRLDLAQVDEPKEDQNA